MSNLKLISEMFRSIKANNILYFIIFKLSEINKQIKLPRKKYISNEIDVVKNLFIIGF